MTFRLPAFAASAALEDLPSTVPAVPRAPEFPASNQWYGIRCCQHFLDASAMLAGERGWVHVLLKQAARCYFVPCPVREPLLLLFDIASTRANTDVSSIVTSLSPVSKQIQVQGLADVVQYDFIVQQIRNQDVNELSDEDQAHWRHFSSHIVDTKQRILSLGPDDVRKTSSGVFVPKWMPQWMTIMPLQAITSSTHFPRGNVVTILAKKEASAGMVIDALSEYTFFTGQSKNVVRLLCLNEPSAEDLQKLADLPCVAKVQVDYSKKTFWPSKSPTAPKPKPQVSPKEVVIKRLDGAPIADTAARLLVAALRLSTARFFADTRGCQLLGFCESEEAAASLHGAVCAGLYVVAQKTQVM